MTDPNPPRLGGRSVVLLDMDGVLVDSRVAISRSIGHALMEQGFPCPSRGSLERFIGPQLTLAFAELTGHPPDSPAVLACLASYRTRYRDVSLRETTVFPGVRTALRDLSERHVLSVATSKPLQLAVPLLVALGLLDVFEHVAAPDLDAHHEDKAMTIDSALRATGASRAVMVGDRCFDIEGAHACGISAIGVSWGIGSVRELSGAGADRIVAAPSELSEALDELLA